MRKRNPTQAAKTVPLTHEQKVRTVQSILKKTLAAAEGVKLPSSVRVLAHSTINLPTLGMEQASTLFIHIGKNTNFLNRKR